MFASFVAAMISTGIEDRNIVFLIEAHRRDFLRPDDPTPQAPYEIASLKPATGKVKEIPLCL